MTWQETLHELGIVVIRLERLQKEFLESRGWERGHGWTKKFADHDLVVDSVNTALGVEEGLAIHGEQLNRDFDSLDPVSHALHIIYQWQREKING